MEIDTEKVLKRALPKRHFIKKWLNENWQVVPELKRGPLAEELGITRMYLYKLIEEVKAERK